MKIRCRRRDIPQTWHAQNFGLRRRQRMEYPMPLEKIAADIYALMTGDTSQGFEQPISVQFVLRQRGCISCQPTIESAVWCYQSSLEACDGVHDVAGVRTVAVNRGEFPAHVGVRVKFFDDFRNACAHDLRAVQQSLGIGLKRVEFSFPAKAEIERGV